MILQKQSTDVEKAIKARTRQLNLESANC